MAFCWRLERVPAGAFLLGAIVPEDSDFAAGALFLACTFGTQLAAGINRLLRVRDRVGGCCPDVDI